MADPRFACGWSPSSAANAAARTNYVSTGFRSDTPIPPAFSLAQYRRRKLEQGGVGTCFIHAAIRLAETVMVAEGEYEYTPLCRCLVGYEAKLLEHGGNPDDGGNVTDALTAMRGEPDGLGTCHEDYWPYLPGDLFERSMSTVEGQAAARRYVGQRPPDAAMADIGFYLGQVAQVKTDRASVVNISHGMPNGIGISWVEALDDATKADDGLFFTDLPEPGNDGHALAEIGYVMPGVWPGVLGKYGWYNLDNSHGELYAPLPPELAALVPGYVPTSPDRTTDLWIRQDAYAPLIHDRYAERVTASGVTGFRKLVPWVTEGWA